MAMKVTPLTQSCYIGEVRYAKNNRLKYRILRVVEHKKYGFEYFLHLVNNNQTGIENVF